MIQPRREGQEKRIAKRWDFAYTSGTQSHNKLAKIDLKANQKYAERTQTIFVSITVYVGQGILLLSVNTMLYKRQAILLNFITHLEYPVPWDPPWDPFPGSHPHVRSFLRLIQEYESLCILESASL